MSEWRECRLGECIEVVNGYAFKSQNFLEEQIENSLPVVKIKNVANGDVNLNAVQYHIYDKSLEKYLIQNGDVLVALTGNHPQAITQVVGEASKYKLNESALLNQRVAKIKPKQNMSNNFLYYFLKDDSTHDCLANQSSGSANQANISKSDIENMPISLPPLEEQKAIAEVLSSLDDKIDLLHRQNRTLESLAQTLFRQWFIEEAKEEWEVGIFGDLVDVSSGKSLKRELFDDSGKYEVLGANGQIGKTNEWLFNEELIYTGRVGTLGKVFLIDGAKKVWLSDNTLVVKQKKYFYFIYFLMIDFQLENLNVGSTQPLVRQSDLKNIEILLPDNELILEFENQSKNIFSKINQNKKQIQTLENLRDTLLPKLLGGEVRVEI